MNIVEPPTGSLADLDHPINRDLVGWWLMNERGGILLHDISGNKLHAIMTNMDPATDWVQDTRGHAVSFDGANDFAVTPQSDLLRPRQPSMSCRFKTNSTPPNWSGVLSYAHDTGSTEAGYVAWFNSSSGIRFSVNSVAGAAFVHTAAFTTTVGVWYDLVVVCDEVNVYLYIDGNLISSVAFNDTIDYNPIPLDGLHFAKWHDNDEDVEAPVTIKDVRHWGRALTLNDVQSIYTNPYEGIYVPKQGAWFEPAPPPPISGNPWNYYAQQ